jgi:hypothetical protein
MFLSFGAVPACSDYEDLIAKAASWLLNVWCVEDMTEEAVMFKSVFVEVDLEPLKPDLNHTHGQSAAARSTASMLIDRVFAGSGLNPLFYQGSRADVRKGREISRSFFWAKDLIAPARAIPAKPEGIAMVDVDYYVDMPRMMTKYFVPYLLYSFQPSNVAKDDGEYKYTFNSKGEVEYLVSGGASYRHHVWNWDGDSVMVERRAWFGLRRVICYYAVERRRIDDDHQVVMLAPLRKYCGFLQCMFVKWWLGAPTLQRLNPVQGDFTRLTINSESGMEVCTGRVGGYASARVPARVDDTVASVARTSTIKITLAMVKSKMEENGSKMGEIRGAELLQEYHLQGCRPAPRVSMMKSGVRRFQWIPDGKEYDADAKPGMVPFMVPLLDGAFVPDMCYNNDSRAHTERVEKLKGKPLGLTSFVSTCMDEFVELFFEKRKHCLTPVGNEVVYERQVRPAQKRILDEAQHTSPTDVAKDFVKREAYESVTDPRMISTINGADKMGYAAFIYALEPDLKRQPWYAFGKSPKEIADRVVEICEEASYVDGTDFSRMDGRVGNIAREFERRLMMYAFMKTYHKRLYELMRKQYALRARTTFGVKFDTGMSRASGSQETSAFNTILNAFVCYLAYRRSLDGMGAYLDKYAAWKSLGLYGGDDGLSANLDMQAAHRAAESVGQVLELQRVRRGHLGVTFLARRYGPDVWYGDANSCCSISRQLTKFHVTVHLPSNITPVDKLRDKAFAFYLTDANTPVIGEFVTRVLELFPMSSDKFRNLAGQWNIETDEDKQYPNRPAEWMYDVCQTEIPDFDYLAFRGWLESATTETIFIPPPLYPPIQPKLKPGRAVVDDDIMTEGSSEASTKTTEKRTSTSMDAKTRFRPRKPKHLRQSRTKASNKSAVAA